jgi:hypothetical protein
MTLWLILGGIALYFGFAVLVGKMLAFSGGEELPHALGLLPVSEAASARNDRDARIWAREHA